MQISTGLILANSLLSYQGKMHTKWLSQINQMLLILSLKNRNELKSKIRELIDLQPNIVDMDPTVQDLLLKEQEEIHEESLDDLD